jgi:hypothetical protein
MDRPVKRVLHYLELIYGLSKSYQSFLWLENNWRESLQHVLESNFFSGKPPGTGHGSQIDSLE